MSKLPGNRLSTAQRRVVMALERGATLHQGFDIDDGRHFYFFGDGRRKPRPITVHKLIFHGWLKELDDGLFGDGQTLVLT
jgi:hypothetical protein